MLIANDYGLDQLKVYCFIDFLTTSIDAENPFIKNDSIVIFSFELLFGGVLSDPKV